MSNFIFVSQSSHLWQFRTYSIFTPPIHNLSFIRIHLPRGQNSSNYFVIVLQKDITASNFKILKKNTNIKSKREKEDKMKIYKINRVSNSHPVPFLNMRHSNTIATFLSTAVDTTMTCTFSNIGTLSPRLSPLNL